MDRVGPAGPPPWNRGLLAAGALTYAKAKVVSEAFLLLSDENAATAEAMLLPELPGKTYGQVKRLAEQAALTVDPQAAERRRRDAEMNRCRVELFREDSGAVALSGRDLPADQALAAHAHVCARAQHYKDSGAFPADAGMDQFRAAAYLDLLNSKPAGERIASGQLEPAARTAGADPGAPDNAEAKAEPDSNQPSGTGSPADGPDGDGPAGDQPGDSPGDHGPGGGHPGPPVPPAPPSRRGPRTWPRRA